MELSIIPQFLIRQIFLDDTRQIHANILMSSLLGIILLYILNNHHDYLLSIPHFCVFQEILHIDGPGCGVTRSILAMVEGNVLLSWESNPSGLFLFFYLIVQIPLRVIALMFESVQKHISQVSCLGSKIVICIIFIVWIIKLIH